MPKGYVFLFLVLFILPVTGMQRSAVKRKIKFEEGIETPTSPSKPVLESPSKSGYGTAQDIPSTPGSPYDYAKRAKRLVTKGIIPIMIHNMSTKPVVVAFETEQGQGFKELPSSGVDFAGAHLSTYVLFKKGPLKIMPQGEQFTNVDWNEKTSKLEIAKYTPVGYKLEGDYPINVEKPVIIKLRSVSDPTGPHTHTELEIVNQ